MSAVRGAGWRVWAGLVVSGICAFLVLRRVEWTTFRDAIAGARPGWLLCGAAAGVAALGVSGRRWQGLVDRQVRLTWREAFESLMIGSLANLVVPRLGDLLRAVLLARRGGVFVSTILASVVIERIGDVVMVLAIACGLWRVMMFPPVVGAALMALTGTLAVVVVFLLVAADRLSSLGRVTMGVIAPRLAGPVASMCDGFVAGLKSVGGPGRLPVTLALSAAVWGLAGVSAILIVAAFRVQVPWYAGLFMMVVVNVGGIIPASPGSIGVYHYLAVLSLSVWGLDSSVSLGIAVVSHVIGSLIVIVLGTLSFGRQGLSWHRAQALARAAVVTAEA